MKFYLEAQEDGLITKVSVQEILEERGHDLVEEKEQADIILFPSQEKKRGYGIKKEKRQAFITYEEKVQFFRALGHLLAHLAEENFELENDRELGNHGAMFDCSRNGVLKVDRIKQYIRFHSLLGLNQMMLYTEDTYEIKDYPYFGALRGRYKQEEIKECVAYGEIFGVELVPCIQTLAHLRTVLRWPAMMEYQDDEDILIVEEEKTYELIDSMLKSIRSMYKTNKIHIGMDEAFYLGFGNYRKKHGIVNQEKIIKKHLDKVMKLCKKYEFEPMIWSDMFFASVNEGNYYSMPKEHEWKEEEKPNKDVSLVYWDYYAHDKEQYERMITLHKKLTDHIYFAGGGWTWNGIAPNYSQALEATKISMEVMRNEGINRSIYTLWMDNGAETPSLVSILPLAFYSNEVYKESMTKQEMETWFFALTKESYESMLLLDKMDCIVGTEENNHGFSNPSKLIFYADPLLGIFDKQFEKKQLKAYYEQLALQLEQVKNEKEKQDACYEMTLIYDYYATLAKVLSVKCELGIELQKFYLAKEKERLNVYIDDDLPALIQEVKRLLELRRKIWFQEYKANGFEVLDIRFSGVIARLESTIIRLNQYVNGEVAQLEELEEERLLYLEGEENKVPRCNLWEYIASASNIRGV